jgi:hypothetical protein
LCKYAEGAGFPFQIESLEDGVDDAVDGRHIDEADHGPSAAVNFDEAAFDYVGGNAACARGPFGRSALARQAKATLHSLAFYIIEDTKPALRRNFTEKGRDDTIVEECRRSSAGRAADS